MKADYPVLVSLAERYDLEYQDDSQLIDENSERTM